MSKKNSKIFSVIMATAMLLSSFVIVNANETTTEGYYNIAKNRAVYHSSSANYNNTGHLTTDGIKKVNVKPTDPIITAQYNNSPGGESVEYAFDGQAATKFFCYYPQMWLQYQFPGDKAYAVSKYSITTGNDQPNRDPRDWQLLGTNDGVNFEVVDTIVGYSFPSTRGFKATFDTENTKTYKAYRLNITRNSGNTQGTDGGWLQLAELDLMDADGKTFITPFKGISFESYWQSKTAAKESLYIDLGGVSEFNEVRLQWDAVNYAKDYEIQISDDAAFWTTIYATSLGKGGNETVTFNTAHAAYVRLLMNASAGTAYKLYEFEVYGKNDVKIVPEELPAPEPDGRQFLRGGNWKLQRASQVEATGEELASEYDDGDWVVATVPGTVLVSYLNNGAIPDPNFGDQQLQISDSFFTTDFWYRDSFVVPSSQIGKKVWLNFNNINWKADIYFNGENIGKIEGAFIRGKFDITDLVNYDKDNYLAVYIHMNENPGAVTEQTMDSAGGNGGVLGRDNPTIHPSIGWDWVPTIRGRNTGIYNDVFLSYTGDIQLIDPWIETHLDLPDTSKAELTYRTEVSNTTGEAITATVKGKIEPSGETYEKTVTIPANSTTEVEIPIIMQNPNLWWPNRYGDQFLYTNESSLVINDKVSDVKTFKFGVREITYEKVGVFKVYVNGVRIYCVGGNWGMDESMLRCNDAEGYDIRVRLHKEANFTMIRNWVGQTGNEEFYNACDKYGILVFDDFWLANPSDGPNPADNAMFMKNAIDKIKVVRKHPSVAFYCGRNEGQPPGGTSSTGSGTSLTEPLNLDKALIDAVEEYDGSRFYVSNSAATSSNGQTVLSGFGPYTAQGPDYYFNNANQNFHSERGMPNVPSVESIKAMLPESHLWPINSMWGLHDFTMGSAQNGSAFITHINRYGNYDSLEEFVKGAQMVNYENHKALLEAPTTAKGNAMLMWMSQSAWPSMVWQTYDYYFDTNAGYFGAKAACQPVNAIYDTARKRIVVANNSGKNYTGLLLEVDSFDLNGNQINSQTAVFDLANDEVKLNLVGTPVTTSSTDINFIKTTIYDSDKIISENFYWMTLASTRNFAELKELDDVYLQTSSSLIEKDGSTNYYRALVSNYTDVPALMIRIKTLTDESGQRVLPVYYSDNYFSLMPGETKEVVLEFDDKYLYGEDPVFYIEGWNIIPSEFGQDKPDYVMATPKFQLNGDYIKAVDAGEISMAVSINSYSDSTVDFYTVVAAYKNDKLFDCAIEKQSIELTDGKSVLLKTSAVTIPEGDDLAEYSVKGFLWDVSFVPLRLPVSLATWTPPPPPNLALNKSVTASSVETDNNGQNVAARAVDGDIGTRWASASRNNEWISVDLGSNKNISKVVLHWEVAYSATYRIEVSNDGENFTTVATNNNGKGGTETITFDTVNARYVRMYGLTRGTQYGHSIWEFEIYER